MSRRPNRSRRALCALGLAGVVLLVSAASASGQAAVDQYVPSTKPAGHHGSAADAVQEATALVASSEAPKRGKAEKGIPAGLSRSPLTAPSEEGGSYPLTPFVIVVLLLFLAGLAARYLPDLIRRLRANQQS
jgi:hypothetical protein